MGITTTNKNNKKYKYNTPSLKELPVADYKKYLARILASGFCKHYRPFYTANDTWIAELASFFTFIGHEHGPMESQVIYDSILPKRDMVTKEVEILYFDIADDIYHRNIDLLEYPFLPISITADLTVHKATSVSYIGLTEHLYLPCNLSSHSSDETMAKC